MPDYAPRPARNPGRYDVDGNRRGLGHLCEHTDPGLTHPCICRRTLNHLQLSELEHAVPTSADLLAEHPTLF